MAAVKRPRVSVNWVLEDAATDDPRVTHYASRRFGRMRALPRAGDHLALPVGFVNSAPVGTMAGTVTEVLWSHDLLDVEVWGYGERLGITDEHINAAVAGGWDYDGTSLYGEGADIPPTVRPQPRGNKEPTESDPQ